MVRVQKVQYLLYHYFLFELRVTLLYTDSMEPNQGSTQPQPQPQQTDQSPQASQSLPETDPQYAEYLAQMQKPQPEEIIYTWDAPSRPFKQRNRQYFTTIITIVLLLSLILFFAGQILPIAVVIAVAFLAYVMATIPPQTIQNQVTTYGMRTDSELYYWDELGRFWFEEKYGEKIVMLEVDRFPHRLTLLVGNSTQEELTELLSEVLLQERPPLNQTEKIAQWLQKKIPIDLDS